ncbi:MFS general substrate transporter [Penicillium malachiteum]|uniref:MFS general substrate transporter n=1 Tax=Penicillium malachiteum TaxID=1324776 RepID=A0AAD6HJH5_9EURO|nr:MFS general substrate transporter [Penicillium malachiteum]
MAAKEQQNSHGEEVVLHDAQQIEHRMDGGLQAWLQVLGIWIPFANTWGLTNSFGVFETFYTEDLLKPVQLQPYHG